MNDGTGQDGESPESPNTSSADPATHGDKHSEAKEEAIELPKLLDNGTIDLSLDEPSQKQQEADGKSQEQDQEIYELEEIAPLPPAGLMPENQPVGVNRDIYCLKCGYNLRGSSSPCPECGQPFKLHKADTYSVTPVKRWALEIFKAKHPRKFHAILFLLTFLIGELLVGILCFTVIGFVAWMYALNYLAIRATEDYTNNLFQRIGMGAMIGGLALILPMFFVGANDAAFFLLPIGASIGMGSAFLADYYQG